MKLGGLEIKRKRDYGEIVIEPFNPDHLGPNSYDLRLSDTLLIYNDLQLDAKSRNDATQRKIPEGGILLFPGRLYLGSTMEYTETPNLIPGIEGRSSVGRLGINVHSTAGFGDVGFCGTWTLELSVVQPVRVYRGMRICQIFYEPVEGDFSPYDSQKYQGQRGPTSSGLWRESEEWS